MGWEAKLDLAAVREAGKAARQDMKEWPDWKKDAARAITRAASSPSTHVDTIEKVVTTDIDDGSE